jgi:hypothetical protein
MPTFTTMSEGPLFMNAWWDRPSGSAMDEVTRAQLAAARKAGGKCAVLTLVRLSAPTFPDEDLRRAAKEARHALRDTYLCSATLVMGGSLVTSIVRGIVTGLSLFEPPTYPIITTNDEDEALRFVDRELRIARKPMAYAQIQAALNTLRDSQ